MSDTTATELASAEPNLPVPTLAAVDASSVEISLRRQELDLQREKFKARLEREKHKKPSGVSTLVVAVIAAAAGIAGLNGKFHPNVYGYAAMADAVFPALKATGAVGR